MQSSYSQHEAAIFQTMLPALEAEGFEVFLHPPSHMLPSFLRPIRPDAIALRDDKKLAIEIMSAEGRDADAKLERLRLLFAEHKDWELRIFYAPTRSGDQDISLLSLEAIEDHFSRLERTYDALGPVASLLTAWSIFEATARSLIPNDLGRPQSPARLVEVLAADGYVTPEEGDVLRRLGRLRNDAAHGGLDVAASREDLDNLFEIIRTLLQLHHENAPVAAP